MLAAIGWPISEVKNGQWSFVQLFADDQRRYRPRMPQEGYYNIAMPSSRRKSPREKGSTASNFRAITFAELAESFRLEVFGFQVWTMARLRMSRWMRPARW